MHGLEPDAMVDDPAVRRLFADLWKSSPADKEVGAWVILVTAPSPSWTLVKWPPGADLEVAASRCMRSAKAIVHIHPVNFTAKYPLQGAEPSTSGGSTGKGNWGAAVRCGVPKYVLSVSAVWKVQPNPDRADKKQVAAAGWER